jgi:hypothetical protein
MRDQNVTKTAVSVSEMARMVGLSRARFYQLTNSGVFPLPCYDLRTRRPIYVEEQQVVCLEVRRRNCGINGRPVLFYAKGHSLSVPSRPARPSKPKRQSSPKPDHAVLMDGLASLGLTSVTLPQIESAIRSLYPTGTSSVAPSEVLRAVFLFIKRQNSADSVR